jgi:hypothetical protein
VSESCILGLFWSWSFLPGTGISADQYLPPLLFDTSQLKKKYTKEVRNNEVQVVDPIWIDRYPRIGGPHHGSSPFLYAVPATLPVQSAVPETIIVQSAVQVQSAVHVP